MVLLWWLSLSLRWSLTSKWWLSLLLWWSLTAFHDGMKKNNCKEKKHSGYTLLTHLLSVDPSLTLTRSPIPPNQPLPWERHRKNPLKPPSFSRHSLVTESVPLSIIILNRSLTYHWYLEGVLLATIQNIFPNQQQVQIKTSWPRWTWWSSWCTR